MEFALQKTLSAAEVKRIRKMLKLKQKELAELMNVSVKTIAHWEGSGGCAKGTAAVMLDILRERSWLVEELEIPERTFPLRISYMYEERLCTVMDVDDREQRGEDQEFYNRPCFSCFWKK